MINSRTLQLKILALVLAAIAFCLGSKVEAQGQELRFLRPGDSSPSQSELRVIDNFRSPSVVPPSNTAERELPPAPRLAQVPKTVQRESQPVTLPVEVAKSLRQLRRDSQIARTAVHRAQHVPELAQDEEEIEPPEPAKKESSYESGEISFPGETFGMPCEGCGMYSSGCGCGIEVGCGCADACCGGCEPACGCAEPSCGSGVTNCGSCVGAPGPDYWCFPVCLPRFKDLSFWAGTHGFRGPRDFYARGSTSEGSRSDSNFGFQTGLNISGRAPFLGLAFPQLSYQIGYQAVGSRYSGTVTDSEDRTQQFVTTGFFRRVHTGLQYGLVWDLLRDDLHTEQDLHQVRYEISLKSPLGREIGLWATNSTNEKRFVGVRYAAVDQYAVFYRCNYGKSSSCRLWGGWTEDKEGLFGAEFISPLNDRWSLQSGFNYLIPDEEAGREGVSEESWNVGINVVWHLGRTARTCARSPFRPLFSVADNGWMFVDRE